MRLLPTFTPRTALILAHDLLATAAAIIVTFYLRFEGLGLAQRQDLLVAVLPTFLVYAAAVYAFFQLYKTKWRFASLPDLFNIFRAVTVLALSLLVLDYILLAPNLYGTFFFGKITIALYWFVQMFFLGGSRLAYRYFHYTRVRQQAKRADSAPTLVLGRAADAEVLLRAIESGAVKKIWPVGILSPSNADQGQGIRGVAVLGSPAELEATAPHPPPRGPPLAPPGRRRARLARRTRGDARQPRRARHAGRPARAHAVRARAGGAPRGDPDAGAPRRPRGEPTSLARRRRGPEARAGRGGRVAAAAEREHRLPAHGNLRQGQGHRGHRRRRLDRRGDLRSRRHFRGGATPDHRELRAGAARGAGNLRRQGWARPDRGPHRRRARPRAHVPPDRRFQARHGVPRRRAQARAAARARLGRGGEDQRVRLGQRGGRGGRGRRARHGEGFDRQGDRAGLGAGRDQAVRGNVLPGARCGRGAPRR